MAYSKAVLCAGAAWWALAAAPVMAQTGEGKFLREVIMKIAKNDF